MPSTSGCSAHGGTCEQGDLVDRRRYGCVRGDAGNPCVANRTCDDDSAGAVADASANATGTSSVAQAAGSYCHDATARATGIAVLDDIAGRDSDPAAAAPAARVHDHED